MSSEERLFFALWPDDAARGALDQANGNLHDVCGGKRMRAANIHLTLVFLGNVETTRIGALREVAGQAAGEPFSMTLDKLGWWRHNRIVWAAPEIMPDALPALVARLQEGLRNAGFVFDDHPTFVPHVTLLRNARCQGVELPPLMPVEWKADAFVLVRSVTHEEGTAYEVIGRWDL